MLGHGVAPVFLNRMSGERSMHPSIQEVKKIHEPRLLALPGVVSVGIGLDKKGQSAIIIGLESPHPETETKLPTELDGYSVVVRITGPIKAQ
jgi:hypothetical protein